jgi:putative OPT family oligopeptide transporter
MLYYKSSLRIIKTYKGKIIIKDNLILHKQGGLNMTSEKKGLSPGAYEGVKGEDYMPFVPISEAMPEFTLWSVLIGCVLAALFAAANTYLALKVGLTIAAGIPAAILGTGLLKFILRRNNILEANMVSCIAAMGESLAGGIVFTLPAIIIWGMKLSFLSIVLITLLGGLLGILFVVPVRRYLTVEEHGKLAFPESMAAAEVLVTGNQGGAGFKSVLTGILGGGAYKFLSGGLMLWQESPTWSIRLTQAGTPIYETYFGVDALASLAGVGFIVGIQAALDMFAGAFIATFGLIPLIKFAGQLGLTAIYPGNIPISEMGAAAIRSNYVRYIGAGAVATGGFISLAKSLPTIIKSFKAAMQGMGGKGEKNKRTDLDLPMTWVIGGSVLVFFLTWLMPVTSFGSIGLIGSILAVLFSFFFSVVSARICGIIGATNNPVSGMTIATLLFITSALKAIGKIGDAGMVAALMAGAVVCIGTAVSGGAGQSMKTTFIIGGTPRKVNIGMYLGVIVGALAAGGTLLLMDSAYGMGSPEAAAPQATLMSMVVKGVMTGQLPWALILVGAAFGIMCNFMKVSILAVALGMYLPINLSTGILVGGIVRVLVDRKYKHDLTLQKEQVEKGILLSSGFVAGDALLGIVIAILAGLNLTSFIDIGSRFLTGLTGSNWFALITFLAFAIWLYYYTTRRNREEL